MVLKILISTVDKINKTRKIFLPRQGERMTKDEIELLLIKEIMYNQELNGIESVEVTQATCPQKDLESFDSLNALEVIISIETKIIGTGKHCDLDASLFYTNKGMKELVKIGTRNCLSVAEISLNIFHAITSGGGNGQ